MKLNIYTISHPIIQLLSNNRQNRKLKSQISHIFSKQLGQFLIYETSRDWISIYKLKIKQIDKIKELIINDKKESHIVMTNTTMNLDIIQQAQYILPNCEISLIYFNKDINYLLTDLNFSYMPNRISAFTKILIISNYISAKTFIKLMDYLIKNKNINIEQIRLISIICESTQLVKISKKYPKLNIYTTKIVSYS